MTLVREARLDKPHDAVVLGAGFAGLCAAIKLREAGLDDFVLFEKNEKPGGVWWDNQYPGVGCDVPSHLYSFSFFQNPDWTKFYSPGQEIQAYAEKCCDHFGLRPHMNFGVAITAAHWDESRLLWKVTLSDGRELLARHFISGIGFLSIPAMPKIDGLDRFKGDLIHTARWNPGTELKGKRIACVGTGASAIQAVPEMQKIASKLTVYQRTPSWVIPRGQYEYSGFTKGLFRAFPFLNRLYRWKIYWGHDMRIFAFKHRGLLSRYMERIARKWLEHEVKDEALRKKLTPNFPIGCKRILISDDWYRALTAPNVEVVAAGVERLTEKGVVAGGVETEVDAVLLCTGFDLWNLLGGIDVRGVGHKSLAEQWNPVPEAYLGLTAPDFPNFYQICGPNSGLGHNSIIFMIEQQVSYLVKKIKHMKAAGIGAMNLKAAENRQFNDQLQAELKDSIWAGRCKSWYQGPDGRISALWSGSTTRFWFKMRENDNAAYDALTAPDAAE